MRLYERKFEIKKMPPKEKDQMSEKKRKATRAPKKPQIPPPSLHKEIDYVTVTTRSRKAMPKAPVKARDIPSRGAKIVEPEPMHIKEVEAAFLHPVDHLSNNTDAPVLSKTASIEDIKKIFDYWTWIVLNLEQKEITEDFCDQFELTAANFVDALKALFVECHPTAYIHILLAHAGKMKRNHKGLWLYSQQGLHKFQKQIYLNHTTRGGADMNSSFQIFEWTYAGIYLWLENNSESHRNKHLPAAK
jgi:hypothetical protein